MADRNPPPSVEPASSPAEVAPSVPNNSNPNKRPISSSSSNRPTNRNVKRARFQKPTGNRHGGVAYLRATPAAGPMVSPRATYFQAFTTTLGVLAYVHHVYNWCCGRDHRFGNPHTGVPLLQFQYAALMSLLSRLLRVASELGYRQDPMVSHLYRCAKGILLPEPICKMVECLGMVKRPDLPTVVPLVLSYATYKDRQDMAQPEALLDEAGRPIPAGDWAIDSEWIADYINRSARAQSRGLNFRTVNSTVLEGRTEMLWGYTRDGVMIPGDLIPQGPCAVTQVEAALGALYCWREHDGDIPWIDAPGNVLVQPHFQGDTINGETLTAEICTSTDSSAGTSHK